MERLHMHQRVLVKKDESDRSVNRHGTVTRVCTDGERAWVLLDAKGGGPGTDKVRVCPADCDAPADASRAERRKAAREAAEPAPALPLFGKDHWSTFAYIETRIVDHGGVPERAHMRCHADRHPFLAIPGQDGSAYPTRLKDGTTLAHHDDWDCLADLEREGLLTNIGTAVNPQYALTEHGAELAARLRRHKAGGGAFLSFSAA